ncbi:PREDICTED: protein aurora borealis [Dinoponera quadriceps]|uniref:Protein aurora borealis n=1 Tax=Dinoponera quadriceps TaxID=609295 RepID=A0A6P3XWB8_DINQU|nr:PREDICTED: protein aurora borealis [Dinoponera quadriceps]
MDQLRWRTPSKMKSYDGSSIISPRLYLTPVKQNEIRPRRTAYQNNAGCLTVLPSYLTPPSGLTKIIRRNPFEADLTNRLHLPMISPTIFAKVSNSLVQQRSPEGFRWSIDELARIQPAKIEESPVQLVCSPDPEVELRAQAAIDRFFKENQIIPSPWQIKEKMSKPYIDVDTPCRTADDMNSTKEFLKSRKEAWTQTVLSLPVNLPQDVEDALKSFYTFTQEQNADNEDINLSNNSLRRKLFFNHEYTDDDESVASLSSVEMNGSMVLSGSPPQSGMFIHGSLKGSLKNRRYSNRSVSLSPPYMSPIRNENGMLCKKIRRRSRSITRLDFVTDMSIDSENTEESQNLHDNDLSGIFRDTNVEGAEDNRKIAIVNNSQADLYNFADTETPKYENPFGNIVQIKSDVSGDKGRNDATGSTTAIEMEKHSMYKSHKQSNTMFSTFDPLCISSSVQDTGYQTYNTSSTVHTIDSYSISTQNHTDQAAEQTSKDDAHLSWKEDMRNVFSSTPSKYRKEKES